MNTLTYTNVKLINSLKDEFYTNDLPTKLNIIPGSITLDAGVSGYVKLELRAADGKLYNIRGLNTGVVIKVNGT